MPTLISKPTRIEAAGNKPKLIDEYIGRVNSPHGQVSIAHMRSPSGWVEPGQTPEFEEFTIVLDDLVLVKGGPGSRLFRKSHRISVEGKDRAGKPLNVLSPAMQKVFGDFGGHVSIQNTPRATSR